MTNHTKQWQDEAEKFIYAIIKKETTSRSVYPIDIKNAFLKGCEFEHGRDKWISVKDGLPKEGELVLIHRQYGDYIVAYISGKLWTNAVLRCRMLTEPTHWQPITLPTAPKTKI